MNAWTGTLSVCLKEFHRLVVQELGQILSFVENEKLRYLFKYTPGPFLKGVTILHVTL